MLDVRTPEEFEEIRLDGSVMLDFYEADFADQLAELDRDVPYHLYCRSGNRSGQTRAIMESLGFSDVADVDERDELMGALRVGLQWDTEVTVGAAEHTVTQVYCAALPVAYANHHPDRWEPLARLVLDAAYEACFRAAALQTGRHGEVPLYLTLLGAGAFGNPIAWVIDAVERAVSVTDGTALDVAVVSYRRAEPALARLI